MKYEVIKSKFLTTNYWVVQNKETHLGQSFWPTYYEAVNAARDLNNQREPAPQPVKAALKLVRHLRLVLNDS